MAAGVMTTTVPWASVSVLERATVMRPLPSSQRCTSPQVRGEASERQSSASDSTATRATSNFSRWAACSGRFEAAAAKAGCWMAVRQITARTSVVRAPVWRWGLASCRPVLSKRRAHPGPAREIHGRPTRGPWRWRWWRGAWSRCWRHNRRASANRPAGQAAVAADGSQAAAAVQQQQRQGDSGAPICVECGVKRSTDVATGPGVRRAPPAADARLGLRNDPYANHDGYQ